MRKIIKQDEFRETGFGNRVGEANQRLMNKDGSSNVKRKGLPFIESLNFYHTLITLPWWKFNLLVLSFYVILNIFFASLYYFIAPEEIGGMVYKNEFGKFLEIFFFSAQSLTTVGYGRLNPVGLFGSTLASIESMVGLLGFALATGLLYGRFSRPVPKLLFSHNILVAPYKGITGLMLRIANKSKSELIDVQATVILTYVDKGNANPVRKFAQLKLEITKITLLSMSWTIVHPIDDESPLYGWSEDDLRKNELEVMVLLQAYEETFAQTVHARSSYRSEELIFGAKFNSILETGPNGSVSVALNLINDYNVVSLEAEMQKMA